MNTSSVARAYRLPLRGVDGAGDGGRLCPSKSTLGNAFFSGLADLPVAGVLPLTEDVGEGFDSDIALCMRRVGRAPATKDWPEVSNILFSESCECGTCLLGILVKGG